MNSLGTEINPESEWELRDAMQYLKAPCDLLESWSNGHELWMPSLSVQGSSRNELYGLRLFFTARLSSS